MEEILHLLINSLSHYLQGFSNGNDIYTYTPEI